MVAFNDLFATPWQDHVLSRKRRLTTGALAAGPKLAIYLIFPRSGLLASHRQAIRHLSANGYTPLVVSNSPLGDADRDSLVSEVAAIIERANFGYDFGGYRDAVLWFGPRLGTLERLAILNDSSWFPLPTGRNWLAEAEALGTDFGAATSSGAVDRPPPWEYEEIRWTVDKARRNFHYASYALSFSGRILADPAFLDFWRRLKLVQAKNRTVRRGEIGLTRWVIEHGYSHGATDELADLDRRLAARPDAGIDALLRDIIIFDDPEMEPLRHDLMALPPGPDRRARIEKFIMAVTARRGAAYALADFLVREDGFPFLKKSPAARDSAARSNLVAMLRTLDGPFGRDILAEIGDAGADAPDYLRKKTPTPSIS